VKVEWTEPVREDIAAMLRDGWSPAEIAEHLGCSEAAIRQMRLHGDPIASAHHENEELDL